MYLIIWSRPVFFSVAVKKLQISLPSNNQEYLYSGSGLSTLASECFKSEKKITNRKKTSGKGNTGAQGYSIKLLK